MRCPTCAAELEASNRDACPVCRGDVSPPTASADGSVDTVPPLAPRAGRLNALGSGVLVAGSYRVVRHLRSGGMGTVYQADDLKLNVPVALKFLSPAHAADPRRLELMLNEAPGFIALVLLAVLLWRGGHWRELLGSRSSR